MGQQGYSQITIDYINAPSIEQCRTNDTFTTLKLKSLPSIEIGENKLWDFTSSTDSNVTFLAAYPVSGNPGFPEATFQTEVFYAFSQLRYDAALMLNVTQNGILRYGVSLKRQAIPLKGMTGGSLDSLIFLVLLIIIFIQFVRQKRTSNIIRHQALDMNILMKELHHRVKNNLQIISSLMSLQSFRIKDPKASQAIRDSQQRIEAMSLIHQKLYTNQNITEINIKEFITDLVDNLKNTYCDDYVHIQLNLKVENETLNVDKAIPLSLIINELVSNASKHAFKKNTNPLLTIDLTLANNIIELVVADNGEGINIEDWNSKEDSFGKELIKTFVKQLKGFLHVEVLNGTQFTLYFPKDITHK